MKIIRYALVVWSISAIFNSAPALSANLTGNGEWQSLGSAAVKGTWSVNLVRDGDSLKGTFKMAGSNIFHEGQVEGEVSASSITLGIVAEGMKQASFAGKRNGSEISGEWTFDAIGDQGVWSGTLVEEGQPSGQ